MERIDINFTYHLFVDCPKCGELIDIIDQDDDSRFAKCIFSNDWDAIAGMSIYCDNCDYEFEAGKVIY